MSVQALAALLDHGTELGLGDGAYLVLLSIANHADPAGANAWPAIATIAREANRERRSVRRILRELEAAGAVEIGRQRGGHLDTRADRRPNRYRIVWAGLGITPPAGGHTRPPAADHGGTLTPPRGDTAMTPEQSLERKHARARSVAVDNRPALREYRAGEGFLS